ncbi:MAG: peptidoglycan recognition family protein [Phycisphaerae bacterium]
MQRNALGLLLIVLFATGCETPAKRDSVPPPAPLLATRRPAPAPPLRAAPRTEPTPQVAPPPPQDYSAAGMRLRPWEWAPPAGVQRGRWNAIVIHHSASDKATPQGMDSWHRQRGWSNGLGYHFVIGRGVNFPDGDVFVGPRWKKQVAGAHCASRAGNYFGAWREGGFFNNRGIGICLIGNFEGESPTPRQLAAVQQLVRYLCDQYGISPRNVHGHGEVTGKTACPGRRLDVAAIRRSVERLTASSQ